MRYNMSVEKKRKSKENDKEDVIMRLFGKKTAEEKRQSHKHLLESMEEMARYMVLFQSR